MESDQIKDIWAFRLLIKRARIPHLHRKIGWQQSNEIPPPKRPVFDQREFSKQELSNGENVWWRSEGMMLRLMMSYKQS